MAVSELPGNPNAVWTVRRHVEGMQYFPAAWEGDDFWCILFGCFWFYVQGDRKAAAWWLCAIPKSCVLNQQPPACTWKPPSGPLELSRFPLTKKHLPAAASVTQYAVSGGLKLLNFSFFPTSHKFLL